MEIDLTGILAIALVLAYVLRKLHVLWTEKKKQELEQIDLEVEDLLDEADREAAPLFALQWTELELIENGHLDPERERLDWDVQNRLIKASL